MREEGCLERWASNYDITADIPCSDCCNEPTLEMNFRLLYDTITVNSDSIYFDGANNPFRHIRSEFFFSRFRGSDKGGDTIKYADTVLILDEIYNEDYFFTTVDDERDVGSIREIDSLYTLSFYIGLAENMQDTSIITSDDIHLAAANDSLFTEEGTYALFNHIIALGDTIPFDTIKYTITAPIEELMLSFTLGTDGVPLSEGLDKTFGIDYFLDNATNGIDFVNNTATEVGDAFLNNLQQSFFISVID